DRVARARPGRGRDAGARGPAGGGRRPRRLAGPVRARGGAHRSRRGAAARKPARRGAGAAPQGYRARRDLRRGAGLGARPGGARSHGRAAAQRQADRDRRPDRERAARRRDGRGGPDEPADRPDALRHPEDGRGPPLERLPEARDLLARRARAGPAGAHSSRVARTPAEAPRVRRSNVLALATLAAALAMFPHTAGGVPCSRPGTWPHTPDAAWLARAIARSGFPRIGCTGSALVVDTGGHGRSGHDLYVWTVRARTTGGYRFTRSNEVAGVVVHSDGLRAAWRARRRGAWV